MGERKEVVLLTGARAPWDLRPLNCCGKSGTVTNCIFLLPTKKHRKQFHKYKKEVKIVWGDALNREDVVSLQGD